MLTLAVLCALTLTSAAQQPRSAFEVAPIKAAASARRSLPLGRPL